MKRAIVTDIHHGQPRHTKRGDTALDQMARFDQKMQQAAPDLVIDHGDRITYEGAERDSVLRSEVADAFASTDVPPHHV